MSALQHITQAETYLKQTTISYPEWKRRLDRGLYQDVKTTSWWKAFNELDLAKKDLAPVASAAKAASGAIYLFGDK